MFTDDAIAVLKRASPDFQFRSIDRAIEIGVFHRGQPVGHLEHNEMTDRQPVAEVMGLYKDARSRTYPYGVPWDEKVHKPKGYRVYYRDSWQQCFRGILAKVPRLVKRRIRKFLRKRGFVL